MDERGDVTLAQVERQARRARRWGAGTAVVIGVALAAFWGTATIDAAAGYVVAVIMAVAATLGGIGALAHTIALSREVRRGRRALAAGRRLPAARVVNRRRPS